MAETCKHLDQIKDTPPSGPGCVECLAEDGWWMHLRRCVTCGHIGCCDDSPSKHATMHAQATSHPIIQSYEPDEDWFWCYIDEVMFQLPARGPKPSHPPGWSPGPPGKIPKW